MNDIKNEKNNDLLLEKIFSGKIIMDYKDIDLRQKLTTIIQKLIDQDFTGLVQLLYKIDVSEQALKSKLRNAPLEQSANVIVDAILERLSEKNKTKDSFHFDVDNIPEDERW